MKSAKKVVLTLATLLLFTGSAFAINLRPIDFKSPPDYPGEDSLQTIFDNITQSPNSLDAVNDQSGVDLWQKSEGDISAYAITMFTSSSGSLGLWSPNSSHEVILTSLIAPDDPNSGDIKDGKTSVSFQVAGDYLAFDVDGDGDDDILGGFSSFGFFWDPGSIGGTRYYTMDSKNTVGDSGFKNLDGTSAASARALVYGLDDGFQVDKNFYGNTSFSDGVQDIFTASRAAEVLGGYINDWIVAFEDGTDGDGNDAVFLMEDMKPVPEPATMVLLGLGLICIGTFGRKKGLFVKKA